MAKETQTETTEFEITPEDPPAHRGGAAASVKQAKIAETLKATPEQWFKVAAEEKNDGLATAIRKSTGVAFRDGRYEAKASKTGEKSYSIWARYLGPVE